MLFLLVFGLLCVLFGLALEGASLYCLRAMWVKGSFANNWKYEMADRIMYWPKLLMLPIGVALIATSLFSLPGMIVFLVGLLFWVMATRLLEMSIGGYFSRKKRSAISAKHSASVRADQSPTRDVPRPPREQARSIDLKKYQKPK